MRRIPRIDGAVVERLAEVVQDEEGLGGHSVNFLSLSVEGAFPVGASLTVTEGQVGKAVGGLALASILQGFPIVWEEVLCLVDRLALEVVDVVGAVLWVLVRP